MIQQFENIQLYQLDRNLAAWQAVRTSGRPPLGWAKAIRQGLGMTALALGRRLGISQAGVAKLEKAEAEDRITLGSLRKLAEALNCEVHYALIPREPLESMIKNRAIELAKERLSMVSHSMALEGQQVSGQDRDKQVEFLALEILAGPRRDLW
jgi:predicted DNA-binding mobile mystery protein A